MSFFDRLFGGKKKKIQEPAVSQEEKQVLLEEISQSTLFKDLSKERIEKIFSVMESVFVSAGDVIIREGDEGDFYYLLVRGTAKVMRNQPESEEPKIVAVFDKPTAFGEEALISNAKRNATIVMDTEGAIMRLSKDAFNDYVKEPMLEWVSAPQAEKQIVKGAKWLDVRDDEAVKQSSLPGALTIPIIDIRARSGELAKETLYICYCENGRMSSTAAFILKQMGFNAVVLRGGLQSLRRAGIS